MCKIFSDYVNTYLLRMERAKKGVSAKEMAECIGKSSPTSYYNIENGEVEARITDMVRISHKLGKPVEYFFNLKLQDSCSLEETTAS